MKKNKILIGTLVLLLIITFNGNVYGEEDFDDHLYISGTRDYEKAYEVFDYVNEARKEAGLNELVMDESLLEISMKRAAETVILFSHIRPNGLDVFSISDLCYGENIAFGQSTSKKAFNDWMESKSHRENILDNLYNSIGIGVFEYEGKVYWCQLFGIYEGQKVERRSDKLKTQERLEVTREEFYDKVNKKIVKFDIRNIEDISKLEIFKEIPLQLTDGKIDYDNKGIRWESTNEDVAIIRNNNIKALKAGKTTIKAYSISGLVFSQDIVIYGWENMNDNWKYVKKDGSYAKDEWIWLPIDINGDLLVDKHNWKYFDKDGNNIEVFYIDENGTWLSKVGPYEEYYKGWWENESGMKYFFRRTNGKRVEGFQFIDGSWKYFRKSGTLVTSWQWIDGNWKYFKKDGSLVKDKWLWLKIDSDGKREKSNWKYFNDKGNSQTTFYIDGDDVWLSQKGPNSEYYRGWWVNESGMIYYFRESSGKRVEGFQFIDGSWRYFRNSGTLVKGKQFINGKTYNFDDEGRLIF